MRGSSARLCDHSLRLGRALKLSHDDLQALERGALLHDIGKLRVSNDVLLKKSLLTYDDIDTRKARVIAQYVRWFGPEAANPDEYVDLSWDAQPLHRGCPVAIPAPGALVGFGKALRRPEGLLHFASTETATKWSGYMDGAIRAGEAAAAEAQAAL